MSSLKEFFIQLLNPGGINSNKLTMSSEPRPVNQLVQPRVRNDPPQMGVETMQPPARGYSAQSQPSNGGGFLSGLQNLFGGGQTDDRNMTVNWLVQQGEDPGRAQIIASDPQALQSYLLDKTQRQKPIEINGRLVDPTTYQVLADFSDQPKDDYKIVGDRIVRVGPAGVSDVTPQNANSGKFRFSGSSVEAQALNGLMDSGTLTEAQAQDLAAGKTVTNPVDGSLVFLTPSGIFTKPADGGPAQPVQAPGATPAPAGTAAPSSAPVASTPPPSMAPAPQVAAPAAPEGPRSGIIPLTEGKPGKLATEAETRARALYTVAAPDLKRVEENFSALSSFYDQASGALAGVVGADNFLTSPQYQQASNALSNVAQTYMYVTSGASAPEAEVQRMVRSLTPRPGESAASVRDKLDRVKTMVTAIRQAGGNWSPPATGETNGVIDYQDWLKGN